MAEQAEPLARMEQRMKQQMEEQMKVVNDQMAQMRLMMAELITGRRQSPAAPAAPTFQAQTSFDPRITAQGDGTYDGMPPLEDVVLLGVTNAVPPPVNVIPPGVRGTTQTFGYTGLPTARIVTPPLVTIPQPRGTIGIMNDESAKLLAKMDQRLREVEGTRSIAPIDLSVFTRVQVPDKFKMPTFEKYEGTSNPIQHVEMYQGLMNKYVSNGPLMVQTFQASRRVLAMQWYTNHKINRMDSWEDAANAFIKHFKFNLDVTISREDLERTELKKGETLKEYATRWRNMAGQIMPEPPERDLMKLFVSTLPLAIRSRMSVTAVRTFSELISMGEEIESGLKKGWYGEATAFGKRFLGKKDKDHSPEVNMTYVQKVPADVQKMQVAPQRTPGYSRQNRRTNRCKNRTFTPLPGTLSQVLDVLRKKGLLSSEPQRPNPAKYPRYDPTKKCDYHSNEQGHSVDDCPVLKHRIQDLLETGAFAFQPTGKPNVQSNPLPDHSGDI
ncbi:uncharacterized protein LOC115733680 [Rhodamnia argentea]|uniref:Uncharacterized protein LOC115733680 n=1 Tax=Rhodamnia argentea TaxID=178133 RepID=A0A8B8NCJ0_9MYRT|nr:uncharacterized protein LOC115733680 [Rhodamnia argentea]